MTIGKCADLDPGLISFAYVSFAEKVTVGSLHDDAVVTFLHCDFMQGFERTDDTGVVLMYECRQANTKMPNMVLAQDRG